AGLIWLIPMLIISVMAIHNLSHKPWNHTVTGLYHEASADWWAGKDLYHGPAGMNYLPAFAIVFKPFQALPVPVGDVLWRISAAVMALALAVKPLGLVLLMLAPVVYAPLRWRLAVAMAGFVLFPFLFAPPGYVVEQHRSFSANIKACAEVTEHRFADINGILR